MAVRLIEPNYRERGAQKDTSRADSHILVNEPGDPYLTACGRKFAFAAGRTWSADAKEATCSACGLMPTLR